MNQPDPNESIPITTEFISSILKELVASISIPEQSEQIKGWYMMRAFGVEARWFYLKQPDALGREKVRVHLIVEEYAERLVALAETHPDAFDLACYIGGSHWGLVGHKGFCSKSIRAFSAQVLQGKVKRPKRRGAPKGKTAFLRLQQYTLCRWVVETSSLKLTRNVSPSGDSVSACDLVAAAFSEAGMHVTYSQLLDLCKKPNYKEIRDLSVWLSQKAPLPILRQE